jgi:hypothetical protein
MLDLTTGGVDHPAAQAVEALAGGVYLSRIPGHNSYDPDHDDANPDNDEIVDITLHKDPPCLSQRPVLPDPALLDSGGALEKMATGRRMGADFEKGVAENRDKLEKYEALCWEIGHLPAEVALAWLLHNPTDLKV